MNGINTIVDNVDHIADYISNPLLPQELLTQAGDDLRMALEAVGDNEAAQEALIDRSGSLMYEAMIEEYAIRYGEKAPADNLTNAIIEKHKKDQYIIDQATQRPTYAQALAIIAKSEIDFLTEVKKQDPQSPYIPASRKGFLLKKTLGWL